MITLGLFKTLHTKLISALEWLFVCAAYGVFSIVCYYSLFVIGSYYHQVYRSYIVTSAVCLGLMWLLFNVLFNYLMSVITSPGIASEKAPGFERISKHCRICEQPKPPRTRHCKVCDKCVLQMDHHLPFAHNCIGHFNRRYLVNTVTYSEFLILALLFLNDPVCTNLKYEYLLSVQILLTTMGIINGAYTCLCWYLVSTGQTLIQFMRKERSLVNTSTNNNIRIVFGTTSLLKALLPSVRPLQHNGILWPQIPDRNQMQLSTSSL